MSVVQDFFSCTRSLRQNEIDWLLNRGVSTSALAADGHEFGYAIGAAKVIFAAGYFDFVEHDEEESVAALCVVARAEDGRPVDLVAWCPRDNLLAPHYGAVSMLGEQWVDRPRVGDPLRVHRDPLGWLRADRQGVVVLNAQKAWGALSYAGALQAEDMDHGLALRRTLRPPKLNIVIPKNSDTSVAA